LRDRRSYVQPCHSSDMRCSICRTCGEQRGRPSGGPGPQPRPSSVRLPAPHGGMAALQGPPTSSSVLGDGPSSKVSRYLQQAWWRRV
jgi:hypothetical protein